MNILAVDVRRAKPPIEFPSELGIGGKPAAAEALLWPRNSFGVDIPLALLLLLSGLNRPKLEFPTFSLNEN